jgi:Tol biopolymer transport system component
MKKLLICLLAIGIVICFESPLMAQSAEKLFQQGMIKEEAEGNLDGAIEIYYKLVNDASADRNLRAKALMQVGNCYEKLGKKNAKNTYEKLITEYADQTDIVSIARKKLNSLNGSVPDNSKTGLYTQHLKTETKDKQFLFVVSPDGRYYAYVDWLTFEIMIGDFTTGKSDSITQGNSWFSKGVKSNPNNPKWSPDGKKVAYQWNSEQAREVRIVNVNDKSMQVILSGRHSTIPEIETFTRDGRYLLGSMVVEENNEKVQNLVMISIADKNYKIIKSFDNGFAGAFSYSQDGKNLLYARNKSLYIMSMADNSETKIADDVSNPFWSPDNKSILYLANRVGTLDLYRVEIKNGKITGEEKVVKRNLGNKVKIMGVSNDKSIYYVVDNSRYDIFTLDLDAKFNNNETSVSRITNLTMRSGGMSPRFSKDGRYISYTSRRSNIKNMKTIDINLGDKFFIGIYDTETREHRELKLDLWGLDFWNLDECIPDWSFDGNKLLVRGTIRDNYQYGFMTVDVNALKITPVLTNPNNKEGSRSGIGRIPVFSKNKDKIYYTSTDWKHLMEYNTVTKEKKSVFYNEPGFYFGGFSKDELKFAYGFKGGIFIYDRVTNESKKISDLRQWLLGWSSDEKYLYLRKGNHMDIHTITRIAINGNEPDKVISMKEIFPNGKSWMMTMHPNGKDVVFDLKINNGQDIFKLSGVFD